VDRNFLLFIVLSVTILLLYGQWVESQRADTAPIPPGETQARGPEGDPSVAPSAAERGSAPGETAAREPRAEVEPMAPDPAVEPTEATPRAPEEVVEIDSELYRAQLSSHGGTIVHWELLDYVDKEQPGEPHVVLTTLAPEDPGELATPFPELGLGDLSRAAYRVVEHGSDAVVFELARDGITLRKSYRFERGSYAFRLRVEVENASDRVLAPEFPVVWRARKGEGPDFQDHALVVYQDGEMERGRVDSLGQGGFLGFGTIPMEGREFVGNVEWAGAELRYFLAVVAPELPRAAAAAFRPVTPGEVGDTILSYTPVEVPDGSRLAREYRGYIGPKVPDRLEELGLGLEASIGQGWDWVQPLSRFFSWLLHGIYGVVPNYGLAIILLTVLVRVVTAPLTAKQMRSMKRMGELQPKVKELQEKYKDDRQRQSQEMMKLYRETGVNPLGGCLPLLLQFPVFIGLYYALQGSIDLRQAPFVAWIDDLSRPETLFTLPGLGIPVRVLPLIMGASMILQQRRTPTTMDPAQARMMMTVMPVMFTVLFYQFPSGLVLYWMVSNLLAIGHQMWVNRSVEAA